MQFFCNGDMRISGEKLIGGILFHQMYFMLDLAFIQTLDIPVQEMQTLYRKA
jgi:hypothetical protein